MRTHATRPPASPSGPAHPSGPFSRSIVVLALTSFCADVASEMLYPVLPLFLTQQLKAPATIVGLIEGVAEALQYILQGASGWLADRLQRDKPVALVGYAVAALAKPAIGLATGWPQVLVGRGLDRLATGARSAPRDALVASSISEKQRGAAFGLEGLGDNLGAVGGPPFATALLFGLQLDLRWIFYLALVPGLLALLLLTTVREVRRPGQGEKRSASTFRSLPAEYWMYLVAIALFSIGNSSNAFIILKASNIGIPNEQTVLVYAGFNLVAAIASYPAGSLSDSIGRKAVFFAGLAIFVLTYIGFGLTSQAWLIALLFALYGAYQGVFRSVGKAMATDLAPNDLRATSVGLYASVVGVASRAQKLSVCIGAMP